MLRILDWYIIKKFLSTFFFTVLIFALISMIIDFSEKVEKIIDGPITWQEITFQYYPTFVMFITGLLWPLFTLIAVVFFTSRMANNSEIISILNAGVSFRRLLRPFMVAAGFIFAIHLAGSHIFIPLGEKVRLGIDYTYFSSNSDKGKTRDVHIFVSPDTKVYVNTFRKEDSTARNFRIERFHDNELTSVFKASTAEWLRDAQKWRLRNYEIRNFDEQGRESIVTGIGQFIDTALNLTPGDFVDFKEQQQMLTSAELLSYIGSQKRRGVANTEKYEIELYRRTAEPFTIFILTLIGVAIAARKVRGGMGMHLALGIAIGAIFVFMSRFAIVFATSKVIPPLLGIWMPNLVFIGVAIYLISKAQK